MKLRKPSWAALRCAGVTRGFRAQDLALLLGLGFVWGTAFMFIGLGLRGFSPVLFAALRFDLSALLLLAIALARRHGPLVPRGGAQWLAVAAAGVFNVAAYHGLLFWGQQFTTASIAAVIVGLNPVITTVFSHALLRDERVGAAGLLGLALGFAGIVALATARPGSLLDARGLGELAIVAAVASWALGSVVVKRSDHRMDTFAFIAWHSFAGAALLHGLALALERGGRADTSPAGLASLLYLAWASSGLGFIVYFTLLGRVGPIRVNLVSYVAPLFASLAGFAVLAEPLEPRAGLAFALIAAGFALVARRPVPAHVEAAPALEPGDAPPRR